MTIWKHHGFGISTAKMGCASLGVHRPARRRYWGAFEWVVNRGETCHSGFAQTATEARAAAEQRAADMGERA